MNKLKSMIVGLMVIFMVALMGCVGSDSGVVKIDGNVDAVEASLIRVAVGAVFMSKPELAVPAYALSTTLLNQLQVGAVPLAGLEAYAKEKVDELEATPMEKASMMDLVTLVKAEIYGKIDLPELDAGKKLVVVQQILTIVKESAAARI